MKNKTVLTFLSLVCIVFLTGCASAPQTGCNSKQAWYQAGISAEQTRRDLAECQYESLVNGRSYSPIPADTAGHAILLGMLASSSENSRQNQIVQTCMTAKGYSLVNSNAPFLKNIQPPQPTPQQSDADRKLFDNTKARAESGDATAQCNLAYCYRSGKGVKTDYVEAFRWYHKSADQGDAIAQNNLGNCYYDGQGIVRDYVEATKWYQKAAEQNNDAAQASLGVCYFAGQGVTQDYAEAVKWYRKAAEQNLDTAQCYLGSAYANGNGVPKNYIEAYKWYSLSAAQGCREANNDLSIIEKRMTLEQIAEGQKLAREFVPQKGYIPFANMTAEQLKKVTEKIRAKAESGDAEAQYNLGSLYLTGDLGVTKDLTETIKWYQKAADQNYPNMQFPLASAYSQRGVLEQKNGDLDGALADYNKAIGIKPDFTEVYFVRGQVEHSKNDLDGALTDYNKVIEMNPRLVGAYFSRGILNYNLHKFSDALADLSKSCAMDLGVQHQDYSHFYVWLIRARLGEKDAATKELQSYLDNRKTGTSDDWPSKVANFLTGQLTEPDFFKTSENADKQTDGGQHCEAYFYAGSKRLAGGDKTTATDYFEKCLATGCKGFTEYTSAAAELKNLKISQ